MMYPDDGHHNNVWSQQVHWTHRDNKPGYSGFKIMMDFNDMIKMIALRKKVTMDLNNMITMATLKLS